MLNYEQGGDRPTLHHYFLENENPQKLPKKPPPRHLSMTQFGNLGDRPLCVFASNQDMWEKRISYT